MDIHQSRRNILKYAMRDRLGYDYDMHKINKVNAVTLKERPIPQLLGSPNIMQKAFFRYISDHEKYMEIQLEVSRFDLPEDVFESESLKKIYKICYFKCLEEGYVISTDYKMFRPVNVKMNTVTILTPCLFEYAGKVEEVKLTAKKEIEDDNCMLFNDDSRIERYTFDHTHIDNTNLFKSFKDLRNKLCKRCLEKGYYYEDYLVRYSYGRAYNTGEKRKRKISAFLETYNESLL